jgi:acyl dehydratase
MALDYHKLKAWPFDEIEQRWSERDSMLYALALGCGSDPLNPSSLRFAYEAELLALPTMAVVLGYPGFWMKHPDSGINWTRVLHGEQRMVIHQALPASGHFLGRSRVLRITDKGRAGALVTTERDVLAADTGALLATVQSVSLCRGDGGYSAAGQPSDEVLQPLPPTPDSAPDHVCELPTRPETALIYRLISGDFNPLHADPKVAAVAGFERPILHGLATYGIAGRAILAICCDGDPTRLKSLAVRFSAPVVPGETLRTEIWRIGDAVHFRTLVVERDVVVLDHGVANIKAA